MNYDKAQKEIISAMLRNERIVAWHDNENLCVTPDGFKCFIFQPDVQIIFNHEKMTKLDIVPLNLTFRQLVRPDNRIDMTDFCVVHGKERMRIFLNHGENVYVKEAFLKYFDGATVNYYQEPGAAVERIVVTENKYTKNGLVEVLVSFLLPMRMNSDRMPVITFSRP